MQLNQIMKRGAKELAHDKWSPLENNFSCTHSSHEEADILCVRLMNQENGNEYILRMSREEANRFAAFITRTQAFHNVTE